ncbi:MAG: hypothetical protein DBY25_02465 [Clostridiales bacterium]|nr:MAG: hypothetical protein DBY25_02465 [Clostridiales bacterium]
MNHTVRSVDKSIYQKYRINQQENEVPIPPVRTDSATTHQNSPGQYYNRQFHPKKGRKPCMIPVMFYIGQQGT